MTILLSDRTVLLPSHLLSSYHIKVLPEHLDQTGITTPNQFAQYFHELSQNEDIFFLTSSSLMNSTFFTASAGAKQCPFVCVVDSKQQCIAYGLQLIQVAKLIKKGYRNLEIKNRLMNVQKLQVSWKVSKNYHTLQKRNEVHAMLSGRWELQSKFFLQTTAVKWLIQKIKSHLQKIDKTKTMIGLSYENEVSVANHLKKVLVDFGYKDENIFMVSQNRKAPFLIVSLAITMDDNMKP